MPIPNIASSHRKYMGLKDSNNNFTFGNALYDFKEFMINIGWTISKSGCSGSTNRLNLSGDILTSNIYFSYNIIWFVLRSPDNRELLFYRNTYFNTDAKSTGLYIIYSQQGGFSSIYGCNNSAPSSTNPPLAPDAVWLNGYSDIYGDLYEDLLNFPTPPNILPLEDSDLLFGSRLTNNSKWYFNIIARTAAPYSFYFFISYSNNGSVPSSDGMFCMDGVHNQSGDTDNYVFWIMPNSIPSDVKDIYSHHKKIRAWYGKFEFTDRADYVKYIPTDRCRFLPTAPLIHTSSINNNNYSTNYIIQTSNNSSDINNFGLPLDTTNQDQITNTTIVYNGNIPLTSSNIIYLLPIHYTRGNNYQPSKIGLFSYTDLPMTYKGQSSLIMSPSYYYPDTTTCNYQYQNEYVLLGRGSAKLAFKWDGSSFKG